MKLRGRVSYLAQVYEGSEGDLRCHGMRCSCRTSSRMMHRSALALVIFWVHVASVGGLPVSPKAVLRRWFGA